MSCPDASNRNIVIEETLTEPITHTDNWRGDHGKRTAEYVSPGCSRPSLPPVLGQKIAWLTRSTQSISCAALGTPELYFLRGGAA